MTRFVRLLFAVSVSAWLAVVTAASTLAAPPTSPTLNPPPPAFLTCKLTGGGTICSGTTVLVNDDGPLSLFCGTTANPIELLGVDSHTNVSLIRFYDADGNFVGRHRLEQLEGTVLNPVTGLTILTTQINVFSSSFGTPGDWDTETTTQRGVVKVYLPGAGVLLIDVGRIVIRDDPWLFGETGQHPIDQYFGGDTSVLEPVCKALGSPGTPPLP